MLLPPTIILLFLLYLGIAALPWYAVSHPPTRRTILNRMARLALTFVALRISAFLVVFELTTRGWLQLIAYAAVVLLFPDLALFVPARTLAPAQKTLLLCSLVVTSCLLSAACVWLLHRLRKRFVL
jgi:hypothetical protein